MTRKLSILGPVLAGVAVFVSATVAWSADSPLPMVDKESHMGVFSCSGSTCHGAVQAWPNSNVLQNEYVTWQRRDKHAKAYEVLLTERSRQMARNLGLRDAHTAGACLDCHADNVSADRRHNTFQITDGVTCEACHGGAGRWIGTHISAAATHANNIENGLFPTSDPVARAKLCLSCHMGDSTRRMTHRIMAAGHPRLSFELDTFTDIQPAHFRVDDDYRKRKPTYSGVQVWAVGQVLAINTLLDTLIDPKRGRDGLFPELVVFDCHGCHRPMSGMKWEPRSTTGVGPGLVRFNDSNILMLQIIARQVDPALADRLRDGMIALHKATEVGADAMVERARAVRQVTGRMVEQFSQRRFGRADYQALLAGVTAFGLKGEFVDYPGAEQATMALGVIINAMKAEGVINNDVFNGLDRALKDVYATVDKDEAYNHKAFKTTLSTFQQRIP